jgi:hypothetical protein
VSGVLDGALAIGIAVKNCVESVRSVCLFALISPDFPPRWHGCEWSLDGREIRGTVPQSSVAGTYQPGSTNETVICGMTIMMAK